MGGEEIRHRGRNRTLKSERTTQSNEPTRLGLHSKCGLLGSFGLNDRRVRMLEDLLADLGQTKSSRGSIKQPHAEPLLQQCDASADPGFRHLQRAGRGRESVIENDGGEELEIVEIAHHDLPITASAME